MIKQLDIFDDLKIFLELKPFSVEQCPMSKSCFDHWKVLHQFNEDLGYLDWMGG